MIREFLYDLLQKNKWLNRCEPYEYCPNCNATLPMQKGYSKKELYWICRSCGEVLINPAIDTEDDMVWICDGCKAFLNAQPGFTTDCGEWECKECGYTNRIDESETYASEDEYQASLRNPYKGLSVEEVLELTSYLDVENLGGKENVTLVQNLENNKLYVKKVHRNYDISVYKFLMDNPVSHLPKIISMYEGSNYLITIEEYIEGFTLDKFIATGKMTQRKAIVIATRLCFILSELHNMEKPIIHRDIKPTNIIVSNDGEVFLLDTNIAKWYKPDEIEDTKMFATQYYAAPEQVGYGYSASSTKTDIYAVGVILNEMITGNIPKKEKASGPIWQVIEKCISYEPENRYTADELITELYELYEQEQEYA